MLTKPHIKVAIKIKKMNADRRIKSKRLNAVKITFLKRQESKPLMGKEGERRAERPHCGYKDGFINLPQNPVSISNNSTFI